MTNEEVLAEGYAAFNRRDTVRLRELMVDDFVWHEADEVPGRKVCHSAEEFASYVAGFERLWAEFDFEVAELTPAGDDGMVARVRGRGRGKASPHPFELTIHHVWRFRDGRVARMDAFLSEQDAHDAAGLSSQA
jgi:ketosteroid isomerase-like protein